MVVEGQVMDSMKWQARPLPCEVSDVAHTIFDGADGLLLGAATSIGVNPVEVCVGKCACLCDVGASICLKSVTTKLIKLSQVLHACCNVLRGDAGMTTTTMIHATPNQLQIIQAIA